jgi:hypothetical protein
LSFDIKTIQTITAMGVNKSELYESLLLHYQPFQDRWAELDFDPFEEVGQAEAL